MPHDSNDDSIFEYTLDGNCKYMTVTYRIGDDPSEAIESEADEPIILSKDGTVVPWVTGADPEVFTYEAGETEGSVPLKLPYEGTGRELDVETALQHNRVRGTPDPTQGRFIEDEPGSDAAPMSNG